jgi:hypothetical protein
VNDRFFIVSHRGTEIRRITTVLIERQRFDHDGRKSRAIAWREAQRQLVGWQSYDGLDGVRLSIVEQTGFGQYIEARP